MSQRPDVCNWPAPPDSPLAKPSAFCTGFVLSGPESSRRSGRGGGRWRRRVLKRTGGGGVRSGDLLPVLLGEGLLPHGQVLLLVHQPQQRGARLNSQAVVVVLGVPSATHTHTQTRHAQSVHHSFTLCHVYTGKTQNLTKYICLISSTNISITLTIRHNHLTSNISVRYKDLF